MSAQKTYTVSYMINRHIEYEKIEASSELEAIKIVNDRLKDMQVSFCMYGVVNSDRKAVI